MTGHYRQIKCYLKDFFQVTAPRCSLLIKCLFDAISATEHPRIKVEYGDFFLLKLISGEVDKGRFSRTPRTKDADYNSLLGIKGEYMLNEILSGRNSADSIIFGVFYRVVSNNHHIFPMQIGTLWNN